MLIPFNPHSHHTLTPFIPHQITLTMPWKKARKLIKEDPRYKNFGDSDEASTHPSMGPSILMEVLFLPPPPTKEKRSRVRLLPERENGGCKGGLQEITFGNQINHLQVLIPCYHFSLSSPAFVCMSTVN